VPTFTNTRTLMGSPNYMSPEQIRDARRVDARADIWAMGIILQELITDAPVFHGESFPGVCAAIVADPPMPVRTMRPDVSKELESIIERCLQKDAQKRYQTITELSTALSPLGSRAISGGTSQPVIYSSHPRLRTDQPPTDGPLHDDRTVAMPSGVDASSTPAPAPARSGTLESARLATNVTHSALSVPDSRVEIVQPHATASTPRSKVRRLALPLGLGALLAGGALWLAAAGSEPKAVASADLRSPSAPLPAAAPFQLLIESDPPGASVSEGSTRLGSTPFSLAMNLRERTPPRVFVLEKEGFEPYVVRQGAAQGEVRVLAPLRRLSAPSAAPPSAAPSAPPQRVSAPPQKPPRTPPSKPPQTTPQPPSDIRLER
jgi:serine/threonine-protein kinase